jgi:dipeptidyl aminopeptidase/acylaminoacyl peptidase
MFPFFPKGVYDTDFARYASPETYIHPGIPPMLIFHGDKDILVPSAQALVFANDLKKGGDDVTFHLCPGKDHGGVRTPEAYAEALAFFQNHLQPPARVVSQK